MFLILLLTACSSNASTASTSSNTFGPVTTIDVSNETVAEPVQCNDYLDNSTLPLKYCDSGAKVTSLQIALRDLGYDIDTDGYFGKGTKAAVQDFQRSNGLLINGQVGSTTWSKLKNSPTQTTSNSSYTGFAKEIECLNGTSIYGCKARFSNGTVQIIDFPNGGRSNQGTNYVDQKDVVDDYGNTYCVTLFSNGKGTFKGGSCSTSIVPPASNIPATSTAVGIVCPRWTINTCEVTWSNGRVTWINGYHGSTAPITATTTMYERNGTRVCVNLHADGKISTRYC